jgi:hypothetical protein
VTREEYCHQSDGSEKQTCWRVHVTMNEKAAPQAEGGQKESGRWGYWVLTGPSLDYEDLGSVLQCWPEWYAKAAI